MLAAASEQPDIPYGFIFLDKMNEKECPCFAPKPLDLEQIWNAKEFLEFGDKVLPRDIEKELKDKIDRVVEFQKRKIEEYFERTKETIMKSYQASKEQVFTQLKTKYEEELKVKVLDSIQNGKCEEVKDRISVLAEKTTDLNNKDTIVQNFFSGNMSKDFYFNFFSQNSVCKEIFKTRFVQGNQSIVQSSETMWKKFTLEEGAKHIVKKLYKSERTSVRDYVIFIDYMMFNSRDYSNIDLLLVDFKYLTLHLFNFVFALYDEKFTDVFESAYLVALNLRIEQRDKLSTVSPIEALKMFDAELDKFDFADKPEHYLFIKLLLYFVFETKKEQHTYTFKQEYKIDNKRIKIMNKHYNMKALIKKLRSEYKVNIRINDFEDLMEADNRANFKKNVEAYFDQRFNEKVDLKADDYEFREYLEDLRSTKKPEDETFEKSVRSSILTYIFSSKITDISQKEDLAVFLKDVFMRMFEKETKDAIEVFRVVYKEISTETRQYSTSFEILLSLFKNKTFQTEVAKHKTLIGTTEEMTKFASEVALHFAAFANIDIEFAPNIKPVDFFNNFFINFVKVTSFVRSFEYFSLNDEKSILIYARLYIFFAFNAATALSSDTPNSLALKFDSQLSKIRDSAVLLKEKLFNKFVKHADLARMLNLTNIDFDDKNAGSILKTDFSSLFFSELSVFIAFFETHKNANLEKTLDSVFAHVQNNADFYHFNNLYLIIKLIWNFTENGKTKETLVPKSTEIFQKINTMVDKDTNISARKIRTSKHAALLYLVEYKLLEDPNYATYKDMLKDELRKLAQEDLLIFFRRYFFKGFDSKNFEQFESVEINNEVINKNARAKFLKKFFEEFKGKETSKTELYAYLTFDFFLYLVTSKHFEYIFKEKVMEPMIDFVIELAVRKQPETYDEAFDTLVINTDVKDLVNEHYLLAVAYYILAKAVIKINIEKEEKQPANVFNTFIADFLESFVIKYFKAAKTPQEQASFDYRFNIKNLYAALTIVFATKFPSQKFQLISAPYDAQMNLLSAGYFLNFSPVESQKLKEMNNDTAKKIMSFAEASAKNPNRFRFLNFINAEFRNIFYNECRREELGIILSSNMIANKKDQIEQIKGTCFQTEDMSQLKREAYFLLRDIIDAAEDLKPDNKTDMAYLKQLFSEINTTVQKKLNYVETLKVYKRVAVKEVNVLLHPDFQTFINDMFTAYKIGDIGKVFDELAATGVVKPDVKSSVLLLALKDYIVFSQFDSSKVTLEDLASVGIFEILLQKSKFFVFLTSLFINFKNTDPETLKTYTELYLVLSAFRESKLSKFGFASMKDKKVAEDMKKEFETYILNLVKSKAPGAIKTKLFYVYLVFLFFNKDIESFANIEDEACQIAEDVKALSSLPIAEMDTALLAKLVEYNKDLKEDIKYYLSKLKGQEEFNKEFGYVDLRQCEMTESGAYLKMMQPILEFFGKLAKVEKGDKIAYKISSRAEAMTIKDKFKIIL